MLCSLVSGRPHTREIREEARLGSEVAAGTGDGCGSFGVPRLGTGRKGVGEQSTLNSSFFHCTRDRAAQSRWGLKSSGRRQGDEREGEQRWEWSVADSCRKSSGELCSGWRGLDDDDAIFLWRGGQMARRGSSQRAGDLGTALSRIIGRPGFEEEAWRRLLAEGAAAWERGVACLASGLGPGVNWRAGSTEGRTQASYENTY